MKRIHLNFGSNQGDRKAIIGRAIALIAKLVPMQRMELSDYVESLPWGFESAYPFLNRGALIITDCDLHPEQLLDITQQVESIIGQGESHRNPDGTYRDRHIDIDIIDIDHAPYSSSRLTLPHPRMSSRPFVMIPLRQLDPSWIATHATLLTGDVTQQCD